MFGSKLKSRKERESEALIVTVLYIDDCPLLEEEVAELTELEARERNLLDHLQICLQDLVQHQPREIAVEGDVSFTKGVDLRDQLTVQHQGTCDDALHSVENDGIQVAQIFCVVGVTQIDRHPEVDAVFVVNHVEEVDASFARRCSS